MTEAEEEVEFGVEAEEGVKNLTLLLKLLLGAPKSRSQTRRTYSKDGFHFQK